MSYSPGLHLLAELKSVDSNLLNDFTELKAFFMDRIRFYGLNQLGDVFHNFEGGGFTGMVCLTESHIAIHTWPEFNLATFDVYLSNYQKDNSAKAKSLFEDTADFFNTTDYTLREVRR